MLPKCWSLEAGWVQQQRLSWTSRTSQATPEGLFSRLRTFSLLLYVGSFQVFTTSKGLGWVAVMEGERRKEAQKRKFSCWWLKSKWLALAHAPTVRKPAAYLPHHSALPFLDLGRTGVSLVQGAFAHCTGWSHPHSPCQEVRLQSHA